MEAFSIWIKGQLLDGKFESNAILTAPTGTGKTLVVPSELYQHYGGTIVITFPRINLAQSAYDYYRMRFRDVHILTSKHPYPSDEPMTGLVFTTEGSFLSNFRKFDNPYLIMDEVHELSTEGVMILYHLKYSWSLRFLLMSATISVETFDRYFYSNLSRIEYDTDTWSESMIKVKMIDSDLMTLTTSKPNHYSVMIDNAGPEKFISDLEFIEIEGERIYSPVILIGAVGKKNINDIVNRLKTLGLDAKYNIITYMAGDGKSDDEIQQMKDQKEGLIIVATNVLMSGVTLPNLSIVFPPAYSFQKISGIIRQEKISKAELAQWQGRVGRNRPGLAVITDILNALPNDSPVPPLSKSFDVDSYISLLSERIDPLTEWEELIVPVSRKDVVRSYRILVDTGLIFNNDMRSITSPKFNILNKYMRSMKIGFEAAMLLTNLEMLQGDNVSYWLPLVFLIDSPQPLFIRKRSYSEIYCKLMRLPVNKDVADHLYACWLLSISDLERRIINNPSLNITDLFNVNAFNVIRHRIFDALGPNSFNETIANPELDHSEYWALTKKALSMNPRNMFKNKKNEYGITIQTPRNESLYCSFGLVKQKDGLPSNYETVI